MVCTLSKQYNLKSLLHYRFHIEKDKGDAALCTQYNAVLVFWQQFDISQTFINDSMPTLDLPHKF